MSHAITLPAELVEQAARGELDVEVRGNVLELFIDRPLRRNVLHPPLVGCMLDALEWAQRRPEVRCVLLGGRGDAFCAGYDIGDIGSGERAGVERDLVNGLATRIEQLDVPVVAAVHGPAIGGGCDLAVACDIRVGSTAARLGMPPARLGLLYAPDGMRRLLQRAGESTAREMLLTGTPIDARRAQQVGLLSEVTEPDEMLARARTVCDRLAGNAPLSVAGTKRSLGLLTTECPCSGEAHEELARIQHRVWHSSDATEGPKAYRERRDPHFVGS